MSRTPLILVLFAGTAAWAGAEHGTTGASNRLAMLAKNRATIELLVDRGLDLGTATDKVVDRVDLTRQAADAVRQALADAVATQDPDRVVELTEYLVKLFTDGLVPTLETATASVPEGSPSMEELKQARRKAVREADSSTALDFRAGKLAGSGRVKDVSQKLAEAAERVRVAAEPK